MTYFNPNYEKRKEIHSRIAALAERDSELAELLEMLLDVIPEQNSTITINPTPTTIPWSSPPIIDWTWRPDTTTAQIPWNTSTLITIGGDTASSIPPFAIDRSVDEDEYLEDEE